MDSQRHPPPESGSGAPAGPQIGARDWEYEAWEGLFYPEDLPGEWRLAYYANEFRCVLVSADRLGQADPADVRGWLAEVPDDFAFLAEVTLPAGERPRDPGGDWLGRLEPFGERLEGVLVRWPAAPESGARLERLVRRLAARYTVWLEPPPASEAAPEWVADSGAGWVWPGPDAGNRPAVLALVGPGQSGRRKLGELLQQVLTAAGPPGRAYVIVEGDPPAMEVLQDAETILQLLGA